MGVVVCDLIVMWRWALAVCLAFCLAVLMGLLGVPPMVAGAVIMGLLVVVLMVAACEEVCVVAAVRVVAMVPMRVVVEVVVVVVVIALFCVPSAAPHLDRDTALRLRPRLPCRPASPQLPVWAVRAGMEDCVGVVWAHKPPAAAQA